MPSQKQEDLIGVEEISSDGVPAHRFPTRDRTLLLRGEMKIEGLPRGSPLLVNDNQQCHGK